jgi:DegV family protein with EDD domain
MANKVAIVTDSTAYIPPEWIEEFGIRICASIVIFGNEQMRDYYDITAEQFFTRLKNSDVMPTTAQPTPLDFKEIYDDLLSQGYDILGIHISHKLSGTYASAVAAQAMLPDANIEVIDTLSASMGEGWPVLMAARAAAAGKSLAECKAVAERACQNTYVCLTVETLDYLHRGGRIGGAQHLLGTALNLKPLLELRDGQIEPLEKVRTRKKALKRLVEVTVERIGDVRPVYIAALHANAEEEARQVLDEISAIVEPKETAITFVSAAVGTHAGPGTIGLAFMAGYKE